MSTANTSYSAYRKVEVETASQGKLVVMLFSGAIQRAEEAKRQMAKGNLQAVHTNLVRAQDIVAELRASLDMRIQPIAGNLDRLYEYFQHLLIQANVRKDPAPIGEAIEHLTNIRDTWRTAFDQVSREEGDKPAPKANQHGAAVMNIRG